MFSVTHFTVRGLERSRHYKLVACRRLIQGKLLGRQYLEKIGHFIAFVNTLIVFKWYKQLISFNARNWKRSQNEVTNG